ncbi:hypothetical protein Salat_2460000 [Sesamum alatum]|uniref:Uncharacterized protein n=1 Tax=Sesamum alatum TaxID=300844 RepID=A0AAE2CBW9_9LAMI|nr:hypothetical protein Salat_2460000 [Sesamum alatum]
MASKSTTVISQPPLHQRTPPLTQHTKITRSHSLMGRAKLNSPAVRCCIGFNDDDGGSCALGGGTLVEAMREAQPYMMAHRGSTFVVVLSSEIIDGPHLPSILEKPLNDPAGSDTAANLTAVNRN